MPPFGAASSRYVHQQPCADTPPAPTTPEPGATRRRFLLGAGAVGMGAFVSGTQLMTATRATAAGPVRTSANVVTRDKARVVGLVDRGGKPAAAGACVVIQFNHADVETAQGVYNWSVIDNAIATSIAAGAVGVRLRPSSGQWAPAWAKAKFGTVHIVDSQTGAAWDTVRFWTTGFQSAARAFDTAMAARYDSNNRVREVMAWPNGSDFSCETMLRQFGTSGNRNAYLAAGYSCAVDQANILAWVDYFATAWQRTHLQTWVSSCFQQINTDGTTTKNYAFAEAYMRHCVAVMPSAGIGVNNADLASYLSPPPDQIYQIALKVHQDTGARRGDQTATTVKIGGSTSVATMFSGSYLTAMIAAGVRSQEWPAANRLTAAQVSTAQKAMLAADV
ncbi:MAG: hypothetical protein ACOH1Y_08330 [Propionicimonas sp.]